MDSVSSQSSRPTCPICFHETTESNGVHGKCGHEFCLDCLERFLLSPPPSNPTQGNILLDPATFSTPTLGACPMCRQELYLFDVQYAHTKLNVYSSNNELPEELRGSIFVESSEGQPGVIGLGSYHFPKHTDEAPYYNVSKLPEFISSVQNRQRLDFVDCHWHAPSRTFAGRLPLFDSQALSQHHVILSFSSDWRFVRHGVVIKRRRRDFANALGIQLAYPFDGDWRVVQSPASSSDSDSSPHPSAEDVASHEIFRRVFPVDKKVTIRGYFMSSDAFSPCFIQPRDKTNPNSQHKLLLLQTMKALEPRTTQDVLEKGCLPIGHEWTWVDPDHEDFQLTWKRESISSEIPPDQPFPVGGTSGGQLLRTTENPDDAYLATQLRRMAPEYNPTSVWRNVFCQGNKVGLASYHFEAASGNDDHNNNNIPNAYISYENPATSQWPPLDNGQAVPSRVPFHNVSFDPDTRTFCGHILWEEDYGTSWSGSIRWEYEMVFDSNYSCIVGGSVNSFSSQSEGGTEMSRYGESLVYCNAKLWEVFRQEPPAQQQQQSVGGTGGTADQFRARSTELRQRLQEQGATVRTIAMMHRILTSAQDPSATNPIDYNL